MMEVIRMKFECTSVYVCVDHKKFLLLIKSRMWSEWEVEMEFSI